MPPEPPPLLLRTTRAGDVCTVELGGEIDLYNSSTVNLEFDIALSGTPAPAMLAVDLSQVTFMDSMGLGVLLNANRRAGAVGCRFAISAMSPVIEALLEMSGLTEHLAAKRDAR